MSEVEFLTDRFEQQRTHLRAVAYQMLGSLSEAEDAVQEAWLRLSRTEWSGIENLGGWLTTVVGRICLDLLRSRRARGEEPLEAQVPDPLVSRVDGVDPEQAVLLADSVGLAMLVVLQTLNPAERLAFVLHDLFDVPFDEIAPMVDRSPAAARQLASRARRRVRGAGAAEAPGPAELGQQRQAVEAFLAATRSGDFDALLGVLDPDVVLRGDTGPGAVRVAQGARTVAQGAVFASRLAQLARVVLVNGAPGLVAFDADGSLRSITGFTVRDGKVVEIHVLADPERLRGLQLPLLD